MMVLPQYVRELLEALENADFATYAVGGCVRDSLLGLTPHDYDLCTAATPEQIRSVFQSRQLVLAGEKHGTVGVVTPEGVVEITTFRTEGAYRDNRHPDWVDFVTHIDEDLSRRDFTVNAMAWSPIRGLADPFGGREDLQNHILRAVGQPAKRFQEDALRILRGVRFAVRFDLTPEENTEKAMIALAPLMENLARERVFDELCKLLPLINSQQLIHFAPIITQAIPELAPSVGFDQKTPHHAYDVFTHTAYVTEATAPDLTLRWAALLHDVGKPAAFTQDETGRGHFKGHAPISGQMADDILLRLKAPTALRERVVFLIAHHMDYPQIDRKIIRRRLSRWGADAYFQLLALQKADFCSKGVWGEDRHFAQAEEMARDILTENACLSLKDLCVKGQDLMALGYSGPAIGQKLNWLLEQVLDENIPNEKAALLAAIPNLEEIS